MGAEFAPGILGDCHVFDVVPLITSPRGIVTQPGQRDGSSTSGREIEPPVLQEPLVWVPRSAFCLQVFLVVWHYGILLELKNRDVGPYFLSTPSVPRGVLYGLR